MSMRSFLRAGVVLAAFLAAVVRSPVARAETPATQSSPPSALLLLKNNCFGCHNPEKRKGHLVLTSRDLALRGDDEGPVIISGKASESRLISALTSDADPHMPPKKQLDAAEILSLKAWVDSGAAWDDRLLAATAPTTRPVTLRALPTSYRPVLAIALSPDEKQLAVGRRDHVVIHDLTQPDRPTVRVLPGPADAVRSLAWSADGKLLAAGGYRQVWVWAMQSQEPPLELQNLEGRVTALCFLPNGASLIAADQTPGGPGRMQVYDLPDPLPRKTIVAHADAIFSLQCTHDARTLASASADKLVKLWDLPDLKEMGKLEGHTSHVLSLAFNPAGTVLASAGAERDVKVWDVKTREQKITIGPHTARINALAWPAGNSVIAAGDDGQLRLDDESSKSPGRALTSAEDTLYCVAATSDGKIIFAGCHDGKVYIWNGGKPQPALDEPAEAKRLRK